MSDIKSKLKQYSAGLAATFVVATTPAHAQQDGTIDTPKEAAFALIKSAKEISIAKKSGAPAQQRDAAENAIQTQRDITALFGHGNDGNYTYLYEHKSSSRYAQSSKSVAREITAPVDCDSGYLSANISRAQNDIVRDNGNVIAKGKTYVQLEMQPTLSMITPFHLALNGVKPDPNPNVEEKMRTTSKTSLHPIGTPQTRSVATHVFQMTESDFNRRIPEGSAADKTLGSHHKIPYSVAQDMIDTVCGDRLQEINEELLDLRAKPPSGP